MSASEHLLFGRRLWSIVATVVLVGCASHPPPDPTSVALQIVALDGLNPRENGEPQNVDVLVFQLASSDAFTAADLLNLYPQSAKAQAALADTLIGVTRYQLSPGQTITTDLPIDPKTRYVGVIAAFEQFQRASWRDVVQVRDEAAPDKVLFRNKRLQIKLEALRVTVSLSG